LYSTINIIGLALGLACSILIFLWVQDELSFNQMHEKADSIYVVRTWQQYGSKLEAGNGCPPAVGPALEAEYPEVLNSVRIINGQPEHLLQYGKMKFKERIHLSDPSVFEIFTFPFVKGDPEMIPGTADVIVISEKIANKYFGEDNPLGKIMTIDNKNDFKVVGVMQNIPHNSTIRFDIWIPIEFSRNRRANYLDTWHNCAFRIYVELDDNIPYAHFNKLIVGRIKKSDPNTILSPFLYPFKDIYLDLWGHKQEIRTFSMIAFFILLIACINFMNLTTAQSANRSREVGLRKVVGAQRKQLIRQFFGESIIITLLALIIALIIVELFLPAFRNLTWKPLQTNYLNSTSPVLAILGITLLTGLLAGIYPALFLSSFRPVKVLSGSLNSGAAGSVMRKILVVTQFSLSIILIIATIVVFNQTELMKNKNLGLEKDHLLYIRIEGNLKSNYSSMKNELLRHANIQNVAMTSHSPTGVYWNGQDWDWDGRSPSVNPLVTYMMVDADFLSTFKMNMSQGRFFSNKHTATNQVVINKQFADIIHTETDVGMSLTQDSRSYEIIGVVEDFHFKPAYQNIGPLILFVDPDKFEYRYMFIKIDTQNIPATIDLLKETSIKYNPDFPFEYQFLDEDYNRMYRWIERTMAIFRSFAFLAIFVSSIGLFGLAAFMAEQRTKEIGVRKVLGATITGIVLSFSKEFAKWILIANMIAWPIAYVYMKEWLQDFAYKTTLGLEIFITASLIALLIALCTVSYQSIKAALANPVEALRYE
jgi:ABC-type antimicrobial peptide transport system permease subunit